MDSPVHTYLPGLYVKKYENGDNPDVIIERMRKKVSILEIEVSRLKSQREEDRLFRKIKGTFNPGRLIGLYNQVSKMESVSIDVMELLAKNLRKVGCLQESLRILHKAQDQDPKDPEILRELGFVYRKMGVSHVDEAKKYFFSALQINDKDPELLGMIGGLLKREKKYEEAYDYYLKAHELFRNDLYPLVNLGAISAILGNFNNSEEYYKKLLTICEEKINSGNADYWAHLCRGEAAVVLGQRELAIQAYKKALNLDPPIEDIRSASDQLEIFIAHGIQISISSEIFSQLFKPLLIPK